MGSYYLLLIVISGASMWVSSTLKRKFKKYSKIQLHSNMSGKEIAEKKLKDLNANTVDQGMKIIIGSARSMGIEVTD